MHFCAGGLVTWQGVGNDIQQELQVRSRNPSTRVLSAYTMHGNTIV